MTRNDRNETIILLSRDGASPQQIADRFGISRQRVSAILQGHNCLQERQRRGRACPSCQGHSRLLWTDDKADGSTKRRRECLECGHRWNRIEKDEV